MEKEIEEAIIKLSKKEMALEEAKDNYEKALKILELNFSGKTLEMMKKQLKETMKDLQKNNNVIDI